LRPLGRLSSGPVGFFDGSRSLEVRRARHLRDGDVVLLADPRHLGVGEATDVVDHVEPLREGLVGDLGIARLDREDRVPGDALDRVERDV